MIDLDELERMARMPTRDLALIPRPNLLALVRAVKALEEIVEDVCPECGHGDSLEASQALAPFREP